MCVKNKGQVSLTSLLAPYVLQYVKQRNEKVTTIRRSARAIHRITGIHKQASRSTSTLLTEEQMQQINFTLIESLHIIRTGNV